MWKKGQIPWNKGILGLAGKNNPHWKGGNSRCLVCDKLLASRYAKHCREHRPITKKTRMIYRKRTSFQRKANINLLKYTCYFLT